MRSTRNHALCERCWFDGPLGVIGPSQAYRMPCRVRDADLTACCRCAGATIAGIFTRDDPDAYRCQGEHGVLSWSNVNIVSAHALPERGRSGLP